MPKRRQPGEPPDAASWVEVPEVTGDRYHQRYPDKSIAAVFRQATPESMPLQQTRGCGC